jgi:hypothetical protein
LFSHLDPLRPAFAQSPHDLRARAVVCAQQVPDADHKHRTFSHGEHVVRCEALPERDWDGDHVDFSENYA